jgi:hypothetical protein
MDYPRAELANLGHGSGIAQVVKEVKRQMRALGARPGECFIERGGLLRRQTNEEAKLQELRERKAALKACHLPPQPRADLSVRQRLVRLANLEASIKAGDR